MGCYVLPHRVRVERPVHAQGAGEGSALVGEVDTSQVGVHGGSSAGQASGGVDGENSVNHDDTQQG